MTLAISSSSLVQAGAPTAAARSIPAGSTRICAYNTVNNSTATVYTVTAGKTLYIESFNVAASTAASAAGCTVLLEADINGTGTYVKLFYANLLATTASNNQVLSFGVALPTVITVPATKLVRITAGTGVTMNATICGYEG